MRLSSATYAIGGLDELLVLPDWMVCHWCLRRALVNHGCIRASRSGSSRLVFFFVLIHDVDSARYD